jgi:simple sugar transport system ATP-binding protein
VCDRFAVIFHGRIAEITGREHVAIDELANLNNTGLGIKPGSLFD